MNLRQWIVIGLLFCGSLYGGARVDDIVVIETNQGEIEIALFGDAAPKAVENFKKLAAKGYYDGISFHRIIPQFMIQGGDPTGTGAGGESIWGKSFEDEFSADHRFDRPGLLAMANKGPNTNGSQFFITTAATPWLNDKHTIFGEVVKGYDVVQKLESAGSASGRTSSPQAIKGVRTK
jgi:peptidylprolyl isomerase